MKSKKASFIISSEMVIWIWRFLFLIVVSIIFVFILSSYVHREIKIADLQENILITRLLYSQNCFGYEDVRIYPGIIDLEKFNEENLKKCIAHENRIKFKLTLSNEANEIKTIKDEEEIDDLIPLCEIKEKPFTCFNETKYVLIKNEKKEFNKGFLNIFGVIEK